MIRKSFLLFGVLLITASLLPPNVAFSQDTGETDVLPVPTYGSVVGGVYIDAEGVLNFVTMQSSQKLAQEVAKQLQAIPADLAQESPMRKISLKYLNAVIKEAGIAKKPLPDSVRYLGGLTSIRNVIVIPEQNDILLIGPAEPWKADGTGNVVGVKTGAPVMQLEDLIVVLRAWGTPQPRVISCSIDPTQEALLRINRLSNSGFKRQASPAEYAAAMEKAYGLNTVTFGGVPDDSRMAKILIAADYRLKRIGMGQEPAPIRNFASYISMLPAGSKIRTSRFWLAPEYDKITHDDTKLTWELSGVKVKAMTENELIDSRTGARQKSSGRDVAAERWSNAMTKRYGEMSKAVPVFADLKNCMDIAVVVALIHREQLMQKGNCKFEALTDSTVLRLPSYPVPKQVPSQATVVKKGTSFILGCGGVEINPFEAVVGATFDEKLSTQRTKLAKFEGENWYAE